ncbi:MAG TPA: arginyltransferase [Phycisphaerae bacterium]|jgi:arginine-tRNA-protein transferase|nr:arginyltransferase [Phycisphaerae bacterium]
MSIPQKSSHWPTWPLPVRTDGMTVTGKSACNYLPGRLATFRAFDAGGAGEGGAGGARMVTGAMFQKLLDAGFRRSGSVIYQPMCARCRECVPIRVPVEGFTPTRSQRRVMRKNSDVVVRVAAPEATREKWELYERYQREWHKKKPSESEDVLGFVTFLYRSPVESLEFEYRDKWGRLFGVGLVDVCPQTLSSVYFYFDPRAAARSLGTFSAIYEIQWAKQMKMKYWYAGYWIKGCESMSYKSRFGPAEALGTDGIWRPLAPDATAGAETGDEKPRSVS